MISVTRTAEVLRRRSKLCAASTSSVEAGEIFAFLGPNGAGKTTTVEVLEGYRQRSRQATSRCSGSTLRTPTRAWRGRVGIVLQECRMPPELTVRETLEQYAGLLRAPRGSARPSRIVGLEEKADARVGSSRAASSAGWTSRSP